MEKEQRSKLQKATQEARRLLEEEFSRQLLETYDINVAAGRWSEEPGGHLQSEQRLLREKLLAWIEHRSAQINDEKEALLLALREMAFTALNRFVALKLMEARELVRPCVSGGLESEGFQEFTAVAQGLLVDQESSYRLYLETIFEDVSRELRALFDPRDPASLLWPKRTALLELLDILNRPELAELWREDETLGWIYQYFNGDAERKKMREESSAPRNSRELAVRNQFFTPRYVVEFLTDNTLGRIWYEMRQGDTGLKERCRYLVRRPNEIWLQPGEEAPAEVIADEALSQEELLRQPVHIPHRPLKDPREIRMLDPACGSMHFGLYAFDLYLAIYEEAWEIAQGADEQAKQGEAFAAFVAYVADFASKAVFLSEVPRLILLHNIHGVDIDPRATQIARLTLWLRAQRAWQEQGVEVAARPAITRSNVVCAEPMPGERELLADFVDEQFPEAERGLVQQLLEVIFDKMQLAGEAGSLLKIEEEIRDAIEQARREWQKLAIQQRDLFSAAELAALGGVGSSLNTDLQNLAKDFWVDLEERIYTALRDYAEQAESDCYQRQLFAEDAAQGFAFIDISRKCYDVALMNPPFGEPTADVTEKIAVKYPQHGGNLAIMFHDRVFARLDRKGACGAVVDNTIFVKSTYSKFRKRFGVDKQMIRNVVYLGWGTLDGANVEVSLSITTARASSGFNVIDASGPDKSDNLLAAVGQLKSAEDSDFIMSLTATALTQIPNLSISFSKDTRVHALGEKLSQTYARAKQGLAPVDTPRFIRLRWEVPPVEMKSTWPPINHGGPYSPFYREHSFVVNWHSDGRELKAKVLNNYPYLGSNWGWVVKNDRLYGKPGIAYGKRTDLLSVQIQNDGMLFSNEGFAIFPLREEDTWFVLGFLNSPAIGNLLNTFCGQHKVSGYVDAIPVPPFSSDQRRQLATLAQAGYADAKELFIAEETGTTFVSCAFAAESVLQSHELFVESQACLRAKQISLLAESDKIIESLLGSIERRISKSIDLDLSRECYFTGLISYFLGAAFGRWDIRYATGEQSAPELPDPFAPLPICSPGMLQGDDGLPLSGVAGRRLLAESIYPLDVAWDGILVDDPEHPLDLERYVRNALNVLWGDRADENQQEACSCLDVPTLREWFRQPTAFFADHLKRYSKSRRQAPIYWQLSAGNGNYSAWLYYHRFTQDTLYRLLGDFVDIRIQEAEREQFELESQGGLSGDGAELLHEVQALLQDLRLFKSELELVATLWNPNLNDGVIINHAILWRITPYTPWQKKCKECWDKLVKGDYDWAHLAFHLWPERVIRKCTADRSLAIAHGLEERLWQDTNNGNWLQRQVSEAELQGLIAEYSKPAVQNALERFLAAPPAVAAARTRAPRASKSSSTGTTRRPRGSAPEVDAETARQTLLVLTAAPAEGLGRNAIAELLGVEAASLTAVIKQLKEGGQIEQLGAARGAKYRLTESGLAATESQAGEDN